jgi:hypothetical protein
VSPKGEGGTTELSYGRTEGSRVGGTHWSRRKRRLLMLLAVSALCGAAYLAGIWYGTQMRMTCVVHTPNRIECGTGVVPPAQTPASSPETGRA